MGDSRSVVIGLSGLVSAGKTLLIKEVAKLIDDSVTILWDDYDHLVKLEFDDPKKWIADGCDMNKWKTEKLIEDVRSLRNGQFIHHPITEEKINSAKYILVEDPTGRTRIEMEGLIDYLVFIDLPHEISLARTYERELEDKQKWDNSEELVNFLSFYTKRYLDWFHSALKIIEMRILEDSDLIVDGLKPTAELAKIVVSQIHEYSSLS